MKTNAYAIHSVFPPVWGGANFLPKIHLGGHGKNLDSWLRGEGLPNLWTPIAFRGDWNLGEHCAIVYAQGDVPFKVLLIAID